MTRPDLHVRPQQAVELLLVNLRLRCDLENEELRHGADLPALGGAAATPWLWCLGLWQREAQRSKVNEDIYHVGPSPL